MLIEVKEEKKKSKKSDKQTHNDIKYFWLQNNRRRVLVNHKTTGFVVNLGGDFGA